MRVWVFVPLFVGCVESSATQCDGFICAEDKLCDNANRQCVTQQQLEECGSKMELDNCLIGGQPIGVCRSSVCVVATCGDGIVSNTEQCDGEDLDGVTSCLDRGWYNGAPVACLPNCQFDETLCEDRCGDGEINGVEFCEPTLSDVKVSCLDFGYDRGLATCSHFCQPDFSSCESFGFAPVGTGSTAAMRGVGGTGPDDIWYVGLGAVQHFDGNQWSVETFTPALEYQLVSVWNSSPSDVWVVGGLGLATHFDGTAWTSSTIATHDLRAVWGAGPTDVFVAETDGNILRWDGSRWNVSGTFGQGHEFGSIWGTGPSNVYASGRSPGGDGLIHHFNGSMWTTTTFANTDIVYVHGRSATDVWALAAPGGPVQLLHKTTGAFTNVISAAWASTGDVIQRVSDTRVMASLTPDVAIYDAGRLWRMQSERLEGMWSAGPNDVWATTADNRVRHFAGIAWLEDNNTGEVDCLAAVSDTEIYATNDNTMKRWDGDSWNPSVTAPFTVAALWAAATNDLWAVGSAGGISRFNGSAWGTVTSTGLQLTAIHGLSTSDIWAAGRNGTIIHYNGSGWSTPHSTPHPTALFFDVRALSATDVYAVGFIPQGNLGRGVLVRYTGGTTWEEVPLPVESFALLSVWGTAPDNVYVSGFGHVFHYDGQAWTAEEVGTQNALYAVRGTSANDVYVAGAGGFMAYNNGSGWVPMRTRTLDEVDAMVVTPHHVVLGTGDGTHVFLKP